MTALVVVAGIVVFALLSVRHGRDTRPGYGDRQDWQTRP
jgi:hypothetical protein